VDVRTRRGEHSRNPEKSSEDLFEGVSQMLRNIAECLKICGVGKDAMLAILCMMKTPEHEQAMMEYLLSMEKPEAESGQLKGQINMDEVLEENDG
jgi:hypothetical protein